MLQRTELLPNHFEPAHAGMPEGHSMGKWALPHRTAATALLTRGPHRVSGLGAAGRTELR